MMLRGLRGCSECSINTACDGDHVWGGQGGTLLFPSILQYLLHFAAYARKCVSHSAVSDSYDPIGCSPPGSFVHGILQARILKWVAIPFSSRSS